MANLLITDIGYNGTNLKLNTWIFVSRPQYFSILFQKLIAMRIKDTIDSSKMG